MNLLKKARAVQVNRRAKSSVDQDMKDLAMAWVKDEVSLTQVTVAIGGERNQANKAYKALAYALKEVVKGKKKK